MSWIDQVYATPLIGIQFEPDFVKAANYKKLFGPLLNKIIKDQQEVSVGENRGYHFSFQESNGYVTVVTHNQFSVEYRYRLVRKQVAGGLPVQEETKLRPFSELLEGCVERINSLAEILIPFECSRIGLISRAVLDPELLPPGVEDLLNSYRSAHNGDIAYLKAAVLAVLEKNDKIQEQCHHRVSYDQGDDVAQFELSLDWQRLYNSLKSFSSIESFVKEFNSAQEKAKEYVEEVALGTIPD